MKKYPEKEVLLHYKGQLEFDTIGDLIHQLKDRVRDHQVKYVVYKKILMVMIESLENIIRYREHFANNDFILLNYPPEFTISLSNNLFIIESANERTLPLYHYQRTIFRKRRGWPGHYRNGKNHGQKNRIFHPAH